MKDFLKLFSIFTILSALFLPYVRDEKGVYHLVGTGNERGFFRTCLIKEIISRFTR